MEPITLTTDEAREYLNAAVEERGSTYRYEKPSDAGVAGSCYYGVYDSYEKPLPLPKAPGCLIGDVLVRAGMPLADLRELDTIGDVNGIVDAGILLVDSDALRSALARAQSVQDQGGTWGEALRTFEQYAPVGV